MNPAETLVARLEARAQRGKERHKQDVAHIQAHRPEMARWLTEMTLAFGRCAYRVTMRERRQ